jgi:hypothetical protein
MGQPGALLNNKEFRFFLIGLNSIFSTLPQSEYTSRAVSTPIKLQKRSKFLKISKFYNFTIFLFLNQNFHKISKL